MEVYNIVLFILFFLIGLFNLAASVFNWDWYFKSFQVGKLVKAFGRTGARVIYGLLGLLIILFAVSTRVGWI